MPLWPARFHLLGSRRFPWLYGVPHSGTKKKKNSCGLAGPKIARRAFPTLASHGGQSNCKCPKAIPPGVRRPRTAAEEENQPPETAERVRRAQNRCTRALNCCTRAQRLRCHADAQARAGGGPPRTPWPPPRLTCALRAKYSPTVRCRCSRPGFGSRATDSPPGCDVCRTAGQKKGLSCQLGPWLTSPGLVSH